METNALPKILIVDDLPANLTALRQLLSQVEAEIIEASSGNEALSRLVDHEFALLLLDVDMPVMDGYEVASMVRSVEETRTIPIIFLTAAYKDEIHRIKGYEAGAVDYIEKPIHETILLSKVSVFLQLYEAKSFLDKTVVQLQHLNSQLQQSQHDLAVIQFAVDHSSDAAFLLDHHGQVLYVNASACQSLGYSSQELLQMRVPDFGSGFSKDHWPTFWEEMKQKGKWQFQGFHRRQSGEIFPVEISANFLIIDGQENLWASARDITERVEAGKQRRILEKAVEQSPVSIVITNVEGAIEYVNPKFTQITGYSLAEAVGQNPRILKTGHTTQAEYEKLWATILSNRAWHGEFLNRKKDGTLYWENVSISPVRSDGDEISHFVAIKEDITSRRIQEQRLKMAMEASNDGIWDWNIATGDCFFSPRWAELLDLRSEELAPHVDSWKGRIHPADQVGVLRLLEACLAGKKEEFSQEYRMKNAAGDWLWMRTKGKITERDLEGNPLRMVGIQSDISAEKQWLETLEKSNWKLQKSEENYRSLVANVPGVVYRCAMDSDWTMHFISHAVLDLTGYPAEAFIGNRGRSYASLIHPDDVKRVERVIEEAIRGEKSFELEYRILHAQGEIRWVYERGAGAHYRDGQPEWLDGVIVDNTARKTLELDIKESEDRFRSLVESTSDWIWELDTQANFSYVSPRVKEILGYEPEEIVGKISGFDLMPPEEAEKIRKEYGAFVAMAKPFEGMINVNRHKDGRRLIMESSGRPFFDAAGKLLGYRGIDRDITLRKQNEAAIQMAYETQRVISGLLQISLNPRPLHEQLKKALALILGIKRFSKKEAGAIFLLDPEPDELVMVVHQGFAQRRLEQCARIPVGKCLCGKAVSTRSVVFSRHLDERHEIHYEGMDDHGHFCAPITSGTQIIGVICLYLESGAEWDKQEESAIRTITSTLASIILRNRLDEHLSRAKIQAEEATKAKSAFLAAMSHDIRTPMNAILGMGEVLRESALTSEQSHALEVLTHAGENLLALINDILDLSKVEAGQLQLESVSFALADTMEGVYCILRQGAVAKGIDFNLRLHPDCPSWVVGDSLRLRQILLNLMGNAIKFTEKGEVNLTVEPQGEGLVRFTVADTGIGIPEGQLDSIFNPFRQAEDSTSRRFGGTGLGLSICSRLVQIMGGKIEVQSEVGVGSSFHFTLFLPPSEKVTSAGESEASGLHTKGCRQTEGRPSGQERPLSILVADDAEDNLAVISAFLTSTPHRLRMVKNGEEAVAAFKAEAFDFVLMDMQMPVLNGFEATAQIRAWEREQGRAPVPIAALTANAMREDIGKTSTAGCTIHLSKPVKKRNLLEVLDRYSPQETDSSPDKPVPDPVCRETTESESVEPPGGKAAGAINRESFEQLRRDMEGCVERLVAIFLEKLPERVQAIAEAVEAADSTALVSEAHRLKGGALTLGAQRMAELCQTLERLGAEGHVQDAPPLIPDLEQEKKRLSMELEHLLHGE